MTTGNSLHHRRGPSAAALGVVPAVNRTAEIVAELAVAVEVEAALVVVVAALPFETEADAAGTTAAVENDIRLEADAKSHLGSLLVLSAEITILVLLQ